MSAAMKAFPDKERAWPPDAMVRMHCSCYIEQHDTAFSADSFGIELAPAMAI